MLYGFDQQTRMSPPKTSNLTMCVCVCVCVCVRQMCFCVYAVGNALRQKPVCQLTLTLQLVTARPAKDPSVAFPLPLTKSSTTTTIITTLGATALTNKELLENVKCVRLIRYVPFLNSPLREK